MGLALVRFLGDGRRLLWEARMAHPPREGERVEFPEGGNGTVVRVTHSFDAAGQILDLDIAR